MRATSRFRPQMEPLDDRTTPTAFGLYALGAGPGGSPRLQVFESTTNTKVADFLAYEPNFTGGVNAAVADVNSDGFPDVIVGAGFGGGPRVRVFDGHAFRAGQASRAPTDGSSVIAATLVTSDFFAFEEGQRGGTFVTAGNFIGTANADIVVGAGPGGGPRVRIFDGAAVTTEGRGFDTTTKGDVVADFFAFEPEFRNGVTVSANPTLFAGVVSNLVVAPGFGGGPRVRVLNGTTINIFRQSYTTAQANGVIADFLAGNANDRGGLFVSTADYNRDGIADVAVGTGRGAAANMTVYNGTAILSQGQSFSGSGSSDVLSTLNLDGYSNGVTVGSAIDPNSSLGGLLLMGAGGQGRPGAAVVTRFLIGANGLSAQTVADITFDANFNGGVFVSN